MNGGGDQRAGDMEMLRSHVDCRAVNRVILETRRINRTLLNRFRSKRFESIFFLRGTGAAADNCADESDKQNSEKDRTEVSQSGNLVSLLCRVWGSIPG